MKQSFPPTASPTSARPAGPLTRQHLIWIQRLLGVTGLIMTLLLFPLAREVCSAHLLPHALFPALLALTGLGYAVYLSGEKRRVLGLWWLSAGHVLLALSDLNATPPPVVATVALMWGVSLFGQRGLTAALGTLYFFAALGKMGEGGLEGARFLSSAFEGNDTLQGLLYLALIPGVLIELGLAALLLTGRHKPAAALMAVMHLTLLALLIRLDWGLLVWPWNLQLLIIAGLLLARGGGPSPSPLRSAWPVAAVMAGCAVLSLLGLFPSGAQFNLYGRTHPGVELQTRAGGPWINAESAFVKRTRFSSDTSMFSLAATGRCAAASGTPFRRKAEGRLFPFLNFPGGP